jgi:hypothetical protein
MAQAYRRGLRGRILNAVEQAVSTAGAGAPTKSLFERVSAMRLIFS